MLVLQYSKHLHAQPEAIPPRSSEFKSVIILKLGLKLLLLKRPINFSVFFFSSETRLARKIAQKFAKKTCFMGPPVKY